MSLILTFAPHSDESGLGFYRRLSSANRLRGWRELSKWAQVKESAAGLLSDPESVARALGLDPASSQAASQQEERCHAWVGMRRQSADAICPYCLMESVHIRQAWGHAYVTACSAHRVQLIDTCTNCTEPLKPHRDHIEYCPCGQDLRRLAPPASSASQHWLSSMIESDGQESRGAPSLLRADADEVCRLARLLCLGADPTLPPKQKKEGRVGSISEAITFLAPLEALLGQWPEGFKQHVSQRISAGNREAHTLTSLLGAWYTAVRKACDDREAFKPVLKAILEVASEELDGSLGLDGTADLAAQVTEHLRISQAAHVLSVGREFLLTACKSGKLAHRTRKFGRQAELYEIPLQAVQDLARRRKEWIGELEASELAGIPRTVLSSMVAADLVGHDPSWRYDAFKGGPIERSSLLLLIGRVRAGARPAPYTDRDCLQWSDLNRVRLGDASAVHTVMRAIAAGEVKAVAADRLLGKMKFLKTDIAACNGGPIRASCVTAQQLSTSTGWKTETISHWMNEGLLGCTETTVRGKPCRLISPQDLQRFRETYLPLADLAKSVGSTSTVLAQQLRLEPLGAQTLSNGSRRGILVRISELGQLALAGVGDRTEVLSHDNAE